MANSLQQDLVNTAQTEVAGSRSPARFAYQRNWALAELIEYHLKGKDYVFAFEFHDDILIFDSENNPANLEFVQVKTKTTGQKWTIAALLKSVKGKAGNPDKLSIIGKLYENKKSFSTHNSQLRFVTNAYFSFTPPAPVTLANELEQDDQKKITEAIKSQIGEGQIDLSSLHLEQSSLSVEDHEIHIRGILHSFFEGLFGSDHNIPVTPWYQSISDQIKVKNNYPSEQVTSFDDLIRNKCITKAEIENFIHRVNESHDSSDNWEIIRTQLHNEGTSIGELIKLQRSWKKYTSDRLDYDNNALKNLESDIITELRSINTETDLPLIEIINSIKKNISKKIIKAAPLFDSHYINSIILWQYCEQL